MLRYELIALDNGYEARCDQFPYIQCFEDTAEAAIVAIQDAVERELARFDEEGR